MPHPRFRSIRLLALLLCSSAFASVARASSITITSDIRSMSGKAVVAPAVDNFDVAPSTAAWTATDSADVVSGGATAHADGSQTSSSEGPTLGGTGTFDAAFTSTAFAGHAEGQNNYNVRFNLTEAFTYVWSADISAAFNPGSPQQLAPGSAAASAFLYDLDTNTFLYHIAVDADASNPAGADASSGTGILLPGSYWLVAQAAAATGIAGSGQTFSSNSRFDLALTLTPANPTAVPEPGTLTLLGCGAVAALLRRRRQRSL